MVTDKEIEELINRRLPYIKVKQNRINLYINFIEKEIDKILIELDNKDVIYGAYPTLYNFIDENSDIRFDIGWQDYDEFGLAGPFHHGIYTSKHFVNYEIEKPRTRWESILTIE